MHEFLLVDPKKSEDLYKFVYPIWSLVAAKYDIKKYREDIYNDLKNKFSAGMLTEELIEVAVRWKYGKLDHNRIPAQHEAIIENFCKILDKKDLHKKSVRNLIDVFDSIFSDAYVTKIFFAHLFKPSEIPIIDIHNYASLRYFGVNYCDPDKFKITNKSVSRTKNSILAQSQLLKMMIDDLSFLLKENTYECDKFLMMFGKHLAPK
ncbi:MAG: hypothetical protein AB8G05_05605 [Oligoflexales bacterium]